MNLTITQLLNQIYFMQLDSNIKLISIEMNFVIASLKHQQQQHVRRYLNSLLFRKRGVSEIDVRRDNLSQEQSGTLGAFSKRFPEMIRVGLREYYIAICF